MRSLLKSTPPPSARRSSNCRRASPASRNASWMKKARCAASSTSMSTRRTSASSKTARRRSKTVTKSASSPRSREAKINCEFQIPNYEYNYGQEEKIRADQPENAAADAPVADVSAQAHQRAAHLEARPQISRGHQHPPVQRHGRNRRRVPRTRRQARRRESRDQMVAENRRQRRASGDQRGGKLNKIYGTSPARRLHQHLVHRRSRTAPCPR